MYDEYDEYSDRYYDPDQVVGYDDDGNDIVQVITIGPPRSKQKADDETEDYQPPKRSSCTWPGLLNRPHRVMLVPDLLFTTGVITMVADSGGGKTSTAMARCPDHEVRSLGGSGCPQAQ
jgi:hypothetical protein